MAGETIISIAYGLEVKPDDDPYVKTAEQGVRPLMAAAIPGAFLVDAFPFLKQVPEWFPGAGFQKKAKAWKKLARIMIEVPFAAAKKNIVRHPFCWQGFFVFIATVLLTRLLASLLLPFYHLVFKK
jgi:hypothetical protein